MKARLTVIPLVTVGFALACHAYATPAGTLNKGSGRLRPSRATSTSVKRSVHSSGVYDLRRYLPQDRSLESAHNDHTGFTPNNAPLTPKTTNSNKRIAGTILSAAAISLLVASSASRRLLVDCVLTLLASYKATMVRHPLPTKVATGAFLAVLGDALAQTRQTDNMKYNPRRAASFAAFDGCYRFFQHNAFPFIISICKGNALASVFSMVPGVVVGSNLAQGLAALERTLVYQLVVIPLLYYPIFFSFTGYLQGLKPKEILQRAKTSFLPCWKRNLLFWIPTQMVMFGLIDEYWQIPFACVMGMLWSMILSVTAGNAKAGATTKA